MDKYTAAEATELFIGDLRFDAIRVIETSEYRMSQKQALEAIEIDRHWLSDMVKAIRSAGSGVQKQDSIYRKAFKALQGMGFTMSQTPVNKIGVSPQLYRKVSWGYKPDGDETIPDEYQPSG